MRRRPRRIKLRGELCDFGLAPHTRILRDRLSHLGYRLARHRWYWHVYKSYLGGEDVLVDEFGNLSVLSGWLMDRENEVANQPQVSAKF